MEEQWRELSRAAGPFGEVTTPRSRPSARSMRRRREAAEVEAAQTAAALEVSMSMRITRALKRRSLEEQISRRGSRCIGRFNLARVGAAWARAWGGCDDSW